MKLCSDCGVPVGPKGARGLCSVDYQSRKKLGTLPQLKTPMKDIECKVSGCHGSSRASGFCRRCYMREYQREHPEVANASRARRRQRKYRNMTKVDIEMSKWCRVDMKGERCWYCGTLAPTMHVDHAIPLSRGGTDSWVNLVSACPSCNLRKHSKTEQEFFDQLEAERAQRVS